jgi:Tfp pilus assembly protein PilN
VLKIDLLPRHFAVARRNIAVTILLAVLVLVVAVGMLVAWPMYLQAQTREFQQKSADLKPTIDRVRQLESEIATRKGELIPLQQRVEFVKAADRSGAQYWEAWQEISRYIPEFVQLISFEIQWNNRVDMTCMMQGTESYNRFIVNLMMCPALDNISPSELPEGRQVSPDLAGLTGLGVGAGLFGSLDDIGPGGPQEMLAVSVAANLAGDFRVIVPTPTNPEGGEPPSEEEVEAAKLEAAREAARERRRQAREERSGGSSSDEE